jgi:hypothetical protein
MGDLFEENDEDTSIEVCDDFDGGESTMEVLPESNLKYGDSKLRRLLENKIAEKKLRHELEDDFFD